MMRQIGAFFMINLCLVVIATQFSETKRRETERMQHERALRRRDSDSSPDDDWSSADWGTCADKDSDSSGASVSPALSTSVSVFSTGASCYSEMVRYVEHLFRRAWRRLRAAVVEFHRRRRAAAAGDAASADGDERGTLQRRRARRRRRRGRRRADATTTMDVEMNSVGPAMRARRQPRVTVASPPQRRAADATLSSGADDRLTVTVRPASPLAPRASPEPSEIDQSSLALHRSVSGVEPARSSSTLTPGRSPRWSSPTEMEEFDVTTAGGSTPRQPRSASSPRLQADADKRGTNRLYTVRQKKKQFSFVCFFLNT